MKRNIISVVLALLISLPLGAMATILLTPLLWDLEPVLHIELAGHSGPSDWVFEVVWLLFVGFRWVLRGSASGRES